MAERPYTVLSCSISLDGYLDDATDRRLVLSNDADLDRVDALRAASDAILVGATTVRNDEPRLLVRSAERRRQRVAAGLPATPLKVTLTSSGDLDRCNRFFALGGCEKIVYCPAAVAAPTRASIGAVATVVDRDPRVRMSAVVEDLWRRGIRRLMVEGGGAVHTQFLADDLADELHLSVAPFFVGDSRARRFVGDGSFRWGADHRARLIESRPVGDVVLLRYALSDRGATERSQAG